MIGKWLVRPNGQKMPNVRAVFKPLLNMFHGERGSKRWKQALDGKFKNATSVSELLLETLHCFPDDILDAPPKQHPPVERRPERLPDPVLKKQCIGDPASQRAIAMSQQYCPDQAAANQHEHQNGQTVEQNGHQREKCIAQEQDDVLLAAGDCSVSAPVMP